MYLTLNQCPFYNFSVFDINFKDSWFLLIFNQRKKKMIYSFKSQIVSETASKLMFMLTVKNGSKMNVLGIIKSYLHLNVVF